MHWEIRRLYDALSDLLEDAEREFEGHEEYRIYYDGLASEPEPPSFHRARLLLKHVLEYENEKLRLYEKHKLSLMEDSLPKQ